MSTQERSLSSVQAIDERMISFFQDGAKMLGLPKSVGEIFGLLYASPKPLTMVDIVGRPEISKGSVSQGLKMLRTLGAVREVDFEDDRKTYFQADVELKKIVGGFIREEIRPHLKSGQGKLEALRVEVDLLEDSELKEFYEERVARLGRWAKKTSLVYRCCKNF